MVVLERRIHEQQRESQLFRAGRPVLRRNDSLMPKDGLLVLAVKEVDEATAEWVKLLSLARPESRQALVADFQKELADVLHLLFAWFAEYQPKVNLTQNIGRLNGFGTHEDDMLLLREVIPLIAVNPQEYGSLAIAMIHSISSRSPAKLPMFSHMNQMRQRVAANRPVRAYEDIEFGMRLTDEQVVMKYGNSEGRLREMRDWYGRTLKVADWLPHDDLFFEWREPQQAAETLRSRLEQRRREEVRQNLEVTMTPGGVYSVQRADYIAIAA